LEDKMVRIRHIVWSLAAFNAAMCLAFVVAGRAEAQTSFVPCCIDAMADNTLPPPGTCYAPSSFAPCGESPLPGARPCAGVFTGKAIPATLSSTKSGSAEGCVLVNGTITVLQVVRRCTGRGSSSCACSPVMSGGVDVNTTVASGLICP
jgi:hypothetical protein